MHGKKEPLREGITASSSSSDVMHLMLLLLLPLLWDPPDVDERYQLYNK